MKTITIVSNNFWTIYKFRLDIINMLLDSGYHINLLAGKDSYMSKLKGPKITITQIPMNERGMNFFQEILTFIEIYKNHRKYKPALVFNFTLKANIYSGIACRILNIRYISMITGLGYIFINGHVVVRYLISTLLSISLKKSLEVWFTNKSDELLYKNKNIVTSQLTYIIPGAGAVFRKNEPKFNYTKKPVIFIMISRLLKEKGIKEFIETATFFGDDQNMRFILLGSYKNNGSYISKKILDVAVRNHIIEYHDYQEDIIPFLLKCSCIVHPSYREGLSTILLEASALKIPIITTRVPGCIDIIPDETYGTLCEPNDTKSLIDSINKFMSLSEDKLKKQTSKTYNHAEKKFSRSQILEIYKKSLRYID